MIRPAIGIEGQPASTALEAIRGPLLHVWAAVLRRAVCDAVIGRGASDQLGWRSRCAQAWIDDDKGDELPCFAAVCIVLGQRPARVRARIASMTREEGLALEASIMTRGAVQPRRRRRRERRGQVCRCVP